MLVRKIYQETRWLKSAGGLSGRRQLWNIDKFLLLGFIPLYIRMQLVNES